MTDYTLDVRTISSANARPEGEAATAALRHHIAALPTVRAGGAVRLTHGQHPTRAGRSDPASHRTVPHRATAARDGHHGTSHHGTSAHGTSVQDTSVQDTMAAGTGRRPTATRRGAHAPAELHRHSSAGGGDGHMLAAADRGSDPLAGGSASHALAGLKDRTVLPGADTLPGGPGRHSVGAQGDAALPIGASRGGLDATPLDGNHGDDTIFGGGGILPAAVERAVAALASGGTAAPHTDALAFVGADAFSVHAMTIDFVGGSAGHF